MINGAKILKLFVEAAAEKPTCLLDGQYTEFPRDECLGCPAWNFCLNEWAEYLAAIDRLGWDA